MPTSPTNKNNSGTVAAVDGATETPTSPINGNKVKSKTRTWKTMSNRRYDTCTKQDLATALEETSAQTQESGFSAALRTNSTVDAEIRKSQGNLALEAQRKAAEKKAKLMAEIGISAKGADLFGL